MAVSLRATCWSALLPRFRLRWLFAVTAAAAAWTGVITHRARDQQTAVRLIREQGGYVYYDFQERPPGSGRYDPKTQSSLPTWLLAKTGEDFFSDVVFVGLYSGSKRAGRGDLPYTSPQSVAPYLPALRKLRFLEFGDSELNDEALQFIGALKNLELLQSTREAPKVTDAGIAHLADLHKLKTLVLLNSSISDKSLEILAGL